jgi:hypothetical protein
MLKNRFTLPIILSAMYVFSCTMAFMFHIVRHETDKFSAMFIAILTLPWSLLESLFHDFIIATIFHFEFSYLLKNITMAIWVIVNTILIFIITHKIRKQR